MIRSILFVIDSGGLVKVEWAQSWVFIHASSMRLEMHPDVIETRRARK